MDDERICERCCDRSDDVKLVDFQDGTGHWGLCEACREWVEKHGEESDESL